MFSSRRLCRLITSNHSSLNRRGLFDWIPNKIKYMIVPDKRTEKEKYMEAAQEKNKQKIDELLDEAMGNRKGFFPFIIKKLIKRTGYSIMKDITMINQKSKELVNKAEMIIINNPRVKKAFGDDVLISDCLNFGGSSRANVLNHKEQQTSQLEATAVLDGSKKSGTARVVGVIDEDGELILESITISDGRNEFQITDLTISGHSSHSHEKPTIIDVKARDD